MSTHDERLIWTGLEQRLAGVEPLIPDAPPWLAPTESHRASGVVRLGPAFDAQRERHGTRRRRDRLVRVLVVLGALLIVVAGAIVSGAVRFAPQPDLLTGPFGPLGIYRGSDSTGNTALLPDGRVFIMTGTWVGPGARAASVPQLWDPATGELTGLGPSIHARVNPTATLLIDGRVLVVGGFGGPFAYPSSAVATAEIWDPQTGSFRAAGSMAQPRVGHTATLLLDGRVLILGGRGPGTDGAALEIWDPSTGEFTPAGRLPMGRSGHAAILQPDGRVLVWGGTATDGQGGASAEVWDPAAMRVRSSGRLLDFAADPVDLALARRSDGRIQVLVLQAVGRWRLTAMDWDHATSRIKLVGSLDDARYGLAAVPLPDGRVVVFGGIDSPTDATTAVDIWDPATGSFTAAQPYAAPIAGRSLTLLPDGRILIVGPPELGGSSSIVDVYTVDEQP